MALPNQIDRSTPPNSQSPSLGAQRIREFKLAVLDILGIPDATNISAAGFTFVADGLQTITLQDAAASAAAAGQIRRNGAALTYHDGTGARTLVDTASAQTLTGKTLTSPTVGTSLVLDQTTAGYTVQWNDPAAARTLTIPDPGANDTFVFASAAQTLTGKTLITPTIGSFANATHTHQDAAGGGVLDTAAFGTGTLAVARGGTAVGTTPANGQLLIGNGTGYTVAGLTADRLTAITNGAGSITIAVRPMAGHLFGLALSNNATDPANAIDIAAGECASDDATFADIEPMTLTTTLTKRIDAAWAVGTNMGGLDTGTVAANTWYYVWLIKRTDTDVVDALFSASATSPTMPAGYDKRRRIGAVRTNATPAIIAFSQAGDEFLWRDPPLDVHTTNPGVAAVTATLTVPHTSGITAIITVALHDTGGNYRIVYVSPLAVDDEAPAYSAAPLATHPKNDGRAVEHGMTPLHVRTNSSGQVRYRLNLSSSGTSIMIVTRGWVDRRGRD